MFFKNQRILRFFCLSLALAIVASSCAWFLALATERKVLATSRSYATATEKRYSVDAFPAAYSGGYVNLAGCTAMTVTAGTSEVKTCALKNCGSQLGASNNGSTFDYVAADGERQVYCGRNTSGTVSIKYTKAAVYDGAWLDVVEKIWIGSSTKGFGWAVCTYASEHAGTVYDITKRVSGEGHRIYRDFKFYYTGTSDVCEFEGVMSFGDMDTAEGFFVRESNLGDSKIYVTSTTTLSARNSFDGGNGVMFYGYKGTEEGSDTDQQRMWACVATNGSTIRIAYITPGKFGASINYRGFTITYRITGTVPSTLGGWTFPASFPATTYCAKYGNYKPVAPYKLLEIVGTHSFYSFHGWYSDSACTNAVTTLSKVSANQTLYGYFDYIIDVRTYTSSNVNGSVTLGGNGTNSEGSTVTTSANKTGFYTFTSANGASLSTTGGTVSQKIGSAAATTLGTSNQYTIRSTGNDVTYTWTPKAGYHVGSVVSRSGTTNYSFASASSHTFTANDIKIAKSLAVVFVKNTPTPTPTPYVLRMTKVSANSSLTGPSMSTYKMQTVKYTLYSDSACTTAVGTFSFNADTYTNSVHQVVSSNLFNITWNNVDNEYYLKETTTPARFYQDTTVYRVKIVRNYNPTGSQNWPLVLLVDGKNSRTGYNYAPYHQQNGSSAIQQGDTATLRSYSRGFYTLGSSGVSIKMADLPIPTNTPTPSPTNTPKPTPTNTPTPTGTVTPRPTATNTPTPIPRYTVTTGVQNGTISPSQSNILKGTNVTITFAPKNAAYYLDRLVVDGVEQDVYSGTPDPDGFGPYKTSWSFPNISANHSVYAYYETKTALIQATKTWVGDGSGSLAEQRRSDIGFKVYADNTFLMDLDMYETSDDQWQGSEVVPLYDTETGDKISYRIEEDPIPEGYTMTKVDHTPTDLIAASTDFVNTWHIYTPEVPTGDGVADIMIPLVLMIIASIGAGAVSLRVITNKKKGTAA